MNNPTILKKMVSQKGFLMISSYMVMTSLMVTSLALWARGASFWRAAERAQYQMEAFQLAESGMDIAIVNLENDPTYQGVINVPYMRNGQQIGTYSVAVVTPDANAPLTKQITSTGLTTDLDGSGWGQSTRSIVSVVRLIPRKQFEFAVFADEDLDMAGSPSLYVDSYNSATNPTYDPMTAGSNADVMTNATGNGAISVTGNANIMGNATVGPGGDPTSAVYVGPNSSISGTTGAAVSPKVYETEPVPKSAVKMGDVVVDAKTTLELGGGNYLFDSVSITGKGAISFTGPATIFITGNSYIAGNGIGTSQNIPKNLIIHVIGNQNVTYAGNGTFHGGIYAPDSHVSVSGNGEVMGGVISKTYEHGGNGQFHFDEDLNNPDPNQKLRHEVLSWQELNKFIS